MAIILGFNSSGDHEYHHKYDLCCLNDEMSWGQFLFEIRKKWLQFPWQLVPISMFDIINGCNEKVLMVTSRA